MYKNSICFYFSLETEPYNAHKLLLILLTGEGLVKGFFQWRIMWDREICTTIKGNWQESDLTKNIYGDKMPFLN